MKLFRGGSVWRKWDLHVHAPGTVLNDCYGGATDANWETFCDIVHSSDVDVVGIADYFRADSFFEFVARYEQRYPESEKVFFPNVELRLNEAVNDAGDTVDMHVLFRPDVSAETVTKFLSSLPAQLSDANDRNIPCAELENDQQYWSASVARGDVLTALADTFGKAARSDQVLVLVPANNNGIRGSAVERKRNLTVQIDKMVDAIFGS
ncbi:hypothetical protein DMP23_21190 [Amycolatopsis sp. A1MSW2902]|uniref:hypothetical protein n=1 Tax=Amycolatopsis sp. A1MSW2902 TaxID=687413 RepID=UPI00307EB8A7